MLRWMMSFKALGQEQGDLAYFTTLAKQTVPRYDADPTLCGLSFLMLRFGRTLTNLSWAC